MGEAKALILTEKPSVAKDITLALGGFTYHSAGYWESDHYLCTYAVGHLLQLMEPEEIDPRYKRWSFEHLPLIPETIPMKPLSEHLARLKVISSLARRKDVTHIINACDAAREGELIFREIMEYIACKKWIRRLWLQSLTQVSIRKAFENLKDGVDFDGLGAAARCRSYSDWLIGMNATRAATERLRKDGAKALGPGAWSIGRVQTPTLKILVQRELEILAHRPKIYFKILGTFASETHLYEGTWTDPQVKNSLVHEHGEHPQRLFSEKTALEILEDVRDAFGEVSEKREQSFRQAPRLFNLTGLQKHMSMRYRWEAKKTLDVAQRCYEQHKVLTYPRTQSVCLPEDYLPLVKKLFEKLKSDDRFRDDVVYFDVHGLLNTDKVFDNKGVDDHFAIIPTGVQKNLQGDDLKLYENVVRRTIAAFYPQAIYDKVTRLTAVTGKTQKKHLFRTGPIETLRSPGWLAVLGKDTERPKIEMPPLKPGEKVRCKKIEAQKHETKPPPRISEAQLLGLMENAGRHVEDQGLARALISAEGLGTAATRADIIQNLKQKGFIDQSLRPKFKGIHLILSLEVLRAQRVTSAELTAKLELQLAEIEKGQRHPINFMRGMGAYVQDFVDQCRKSETEVLFRQKPPLGPCPSCQKSELEERSLFYSCAPKPGVGPGCGYQVFKQMGERYLDRETMSALLTSEDKTVDGVSGFGAETSGQRIRLCLEGNQIVARNRENEILAKASGEIPAGFVSTGFSYPKNQRYSKKPRYFKRGSKEKTTSFAKSSGLESRS